MNLSATAQASAGSGKTFLLINRLVRLLLLGAEPATILAITFTRKAATEMQHRLLQKVQKLAIADAVELDTLLSELNFAPVSDPLRLKARQLYELLLHATSSVKVTTFHAFCQDVLRRFPLEADVPPGFELLEKTRTLQHQAIESLMVETVQDNTSDIYSALHWLLEHIGMVNTTESLNTFINQRSEWWAYTQQHEHPLDYAITHLKLKLKINSESDPILDLFTNSTWLKELSAFAQMLMLHPTKTNTAHAQLITTALGGEGDTSSRFKLIWTVFFTTGNDPRSRKSSGALQKKMGIDKEEKFLALHTLFCERLQLLQDRINVLFTYNLNKYWYTAGYRALEIFQRVKQEQRLLDFADLEWKTCALLNHGENAQWVQYKLDARVDHFLIDEFQDTNPTQWHLISPLLEEIASQKNSFRSVFLVGDKKQSIYRFRRAEPRLFDHAASWMENTLHAETIPLNKSWRSAPAIISFINTVFGSGELFQKISHFNPHEFHYTKRWGKVFLLPLVSEPDVDPKSDNHQLQWRNPLHQPRPEKIALRYSLEAKQITHIIQELINDRTLVGDSGNTTALRYSDIIILLRNRTHIRHYEMALRQAHIPFIGNDRGTLLKSPEIADMVNLLQWLSMPQDNLALAGVLRSPLFSISDEELVLLSSTSGAFWHDRLLSLTQNLPSDHQLFRASHLLEQWRELADQVPVHDLLDHIYSNGNVLARFAASYATHQRQSVIANLNRFIELALEMDSGRYPSLMRFIQWLSELNKLEKDAPDEPVSGQSTNCVRILTIHAAKGLEAPVVFLADSANKPKSGNTYSALLNWPLSSPAPDTFMLAPMTKQQEPFTRTLIEKIQKDDAREEANLLYVALSRSSQLLYISASKPTTGTHTGWYGAIAQQYALDPLNIIEPQLLEESNSMPTELSERVQKNKPLTLPDPQLAQPIKMKKALHEIAPSKMTHELITQDSVSDKTAQERGIIIHAILEKLTQDANSRPVFDQTVKVKQDNNFRDSSVTSLTRALDQASLDEYWEEAINTVQHEKFKEYFDQSYFEKSLNEVPIIYNKNDETVHGIIDRLVILDDCIIFIDYKSHTHVTSNNVKEVASSYKLQMQLYRDGLKEIWPDKAIRCIIIFTHCSIDVEITL